MTRGVEYLESMVCGRPKYIRDGSLFMLFTIHCDESEKDGVFTMAGYCGDLSNWKNLTDEWAELLREDKIEKINTTRLNPAANKRHERYYRIIERHVISSVSVTFEKKDLIDAFDGYIFPDKKIETLLKNPYFWGFKFITNNALGNKKELGINGEVNFVFHRKTDSVHLFKAWDWLKDNGTPEQQDFIKVSPLFASEIDVIALQSSDLYAGWVRRWYQSGDKESRHMIFPWETRKDIRRYVMVANKDDFSNLIEEIIINNR